MVGKQPMVQLIGRHQQRFGDVRAGQLQDPPASDSPSTIGKPLLDTAGMSSGPCKADPARCSGLLRASNGRLPIQA
jgi:hypothetical protein